MNGDYARLDNSNWQEESISESIGMRKISVAPMVNWHCLKIGDVERGSCSATKNRTEPPVGGAENLNALGYGMIKRALEFGKAKNYGGSD